MDLADELNDFESGDYEDDEDGEPEGLLQT